MTKSKHSRTQAYFSAIIAAGLLLCAGTSAGAQESTFTDPAPAPEIDSIYQLTVDEQVTFGRAIMACWEVEPSYAMVTVQVRFALDERGLVVDNRVDLVSMRGGDDVAQGRAFEAVRTALIRCDDRGYPLPIEKYEAWKELVMSFDGRIMMPPG